MRTDVPFPTRCSDSSTLCLRHWRETTRVDIEKNRMYFCQFIPTRSVTHAGIAAGVGRAFSRVCLCVCLTVCTRSNRKTAWAINTKLGTRILYSSRSPCIDQRSKGQRSRSHGYENRHGRTVASDACCNGLCWRGYACRFDCLCFPVFTVIIIIIIVY